MEPRRKASTWNVANGLTALRIGLVPIFLLTLFERDGDSTAWRLIAASVFFLAALTDTVDGEIARKKGLVTEFGKLADPIADKALIGSALVGLSLLNELAWWVTITILARELGVTVLRLWVIRHGVIAASRGGKAKTLCQSLAIWLYVLPLDGLWRTAAATIMLAAVVLTVATGLDYLGHALRLRRKPQAEG
jgi:CDP-diacylglycerol--glycerol-3-phosphate 3-phosphatidyltransferase